MSATTCGDLFCWPASPASAHLQKQSVIFNPFGDVAKTRPIGGSVIHGPDPDYQAIRSRRAGIVVLLAYISKLRYKRACLGKEILDETVATEIAALPADMQARFLRLAERITSAGLESLSDRERQVLAAVVAGLPNKSIAYDLDISPRTVEVHRANVMAKMKAKSLPQLVRMAIAAGFGPN